MKATPKPRFLGTILPTKESDALADAHFDSVQRRINTKINQLKLNRFPMQVKANEKQFFLNDSTYCVVSSRDVSILFFERRDSNPDHWWSVKPGSPEYKKYMEIVIN